MYLFRGQFGSVSAVPETRPLQRIIPGTRSTMSLPVPQILARPSLWAEAIRTLWAIRERGTLRPNHAYLAWRRQTAYGDADVAESTEDLVAYLQWRRRQRRLG